MSTSGKLQLARWLTPTALARSGNIKRKNKNGGEGGGGGAPHPVLSRVFDLESEARARAPPSRCVFFYVFFFYI